MIAALIFSTLFFSQEKPYECDLIELNTYYDTNGKVVFNQVILWNWEPENSRFSIWAWQLAPKIEDDPELKSIVVVHRTKDGFQVHWNETGVNVFAPSFRHTYTQKDPELEDRAFLEKDKRKPPPGSNKTQNKIP